MSTELNFGVPIHCEGFSNAVAPRDVFCFFDDFLGVSSDAAELGKWKETTTNEATGVSGLDGTDTYPELSGGWMSLTPEATDSEYVNVALNGEAFHVEQGYPLYFETKVYDPDITDTGWWVGLCNSDTEIINGGITDAAVGFECTEAGALSFVTDLGGTEKTEVTGDTIANGAIWKLAFYYDGDDTITFYTADCGIAGSATAQTGNLVVVGTRTLSTTADYCPEDNMMTPTIEVKNIGGSACDAVSFDYILCVQQRRHLSGG